MQLGEFRVVEVPGLRGQEGLDVQQFRVPRVMQDLYHQQQCHR